MQDPGVYLDGKRMELDHERDRLTAVFQRMLSDYQRSFAEYAAKLDALSPLKVLARGYSVLQDQQGKPIRSASEVQVGEYVRVKLNAGVLGCRVEEKVEEHGKENDL